MAADRTAFGAFLRARRDGLTPADAGMTAFPGPRRVPGLRKEELAVLAGLSPDHYSRLEQGRQGTVTDEVLDALSRALRLTDVEYAHLRALAAPRARRSTPVWEAAQQPAAGLLRVMTATADIPSLLLGRRGDVLARNALLTAVLGAPLLPGSSFSRWLFLDPEARTRIVNWDVFARAAVGGLRVDVARHPQDRKLARLVAEVRAADRDVERWWREHHVVDQTSVTKHLAHPVAGPLTFGIEAVSLPQDPDQRLVLYTVEPDSPTARVLPMLSGWADDPVPVPSSP